MFRLATDADVNGDLWRALLRRQPDLEIVRAQDVGLRTADDPTILAWAASENRIVLTHDRRTMTKFAKERVQAGQSMPGVFVTRNRPDHVGQMVEAVLEVVLCSVPEEWKDQVVFLPL